MTDELFAELAGLAPAAPQDSPLPAKTDGSAPGKRTAPDGDLGPLDVPRYLDHYGIAYNEKSEDTRTIYRLAQCLFDPSHKNKEAAIIQLSGGGLYYQCFHQSCRHHTWKDARQKISGDAKLAEYCKGYDPTRARPKTDAGGSPADTGYDFLWVNPKTGKVKFKASLMVNHLRRHYDPIFNEGKDWGSFFYRYNSQLGIWEVLSEAEICNYADKLLGDYSDTRYISNTVKLLEYRTYIPEHQRDANPIWFNLKNCMYNVQTGETAKHDPSFFSRVQLPVSFDEQAACPLWVETLAAIFADDSEKANTLQEFFGYCLYPKIIFPAALFQIGGGSNGKGTVQRVIEAMLGDKNISHISLKRMEEKFGPVELKDKLLNTCGETSTQPLEVTRFKEIAAADKVQAEVKYKSDVIFVPMAKHMVSMNEFPGIKDKTPAFYRRIIVMEYKQVFEGEEDDKELIEKLRKEIDGIFLWSLEGLRRVLQHKAIYQPESIEQAKKRMKAASNNAILFVDEECVVGKGYSVAPPDLYNRYKDWCTDSGIKVPYGKQRFYEQLMLHFNIRKERPRESTREVFSGISLSKDTI